MMRHDAEGFWLDEAGPTTATPPLTADAAADVVIVGAGFAGLWTAWALRAQEPDLRVVVLEAATVAEGPSGRNAGFLNSMWHRADGLIRHFGEDTAGAIARLAAASVDEIEAWTLEHGVEAWFRKAGHLEVSTGVGQEGKWLPSVAACARLGAPDAYVALDADAVRARCRSPRFGTGAFMPQAATVQPARLALGLRDVLRARGVTVCERTRVRALRAHGSGVIAETDAGGRVRAGRAIVAINAAAAGFAPLRGRLTVSSTHMLITEPVPDVLESIGWVGGECISDARTYVHYFRTTPDGRIAFGFGGGRMAFGARLGARVEVDPSVLRRVRADLIDIFPALEGRRIEHAWGGPVDVSPNRLPVLGTVGGRVHFVYGFTGNGVGPAHFAGKILASMALDRRDELTRLPLVEPDLARVPPEPLRYLGGSLVRSALLRKETLEDAGRPVDPLTRHVVDLPRRLGIHIGR